MQILVISSIYPGGDTPKGYTPVVHYFVKEWVKMGYDVRVIHTCTYFPSIYYKAPRWVRKIVQNRIGIALPESKLDKEMEYSYEGVKVYRIPMKKLMPMSNYSTKELNFACKRAELFINREGFKPDHIISHWLNPQLILMSYLKRVTGAVTTMVMHGAGTEMKKPFKDWTKLVADVNIWGYRSLQIKEIFENICGRQRFSFRCFSGIPTYYTENVPQRNGSFKNRFVQVGILLERKYPNKTIDAVFRVYGDSDYTLNFIGDGSMKAGLEAKVAEMGASEKIHLMGRMQRQEIIPVLDQSDVFILISSHEVFGLVYIEAMARGCIVVASRGEGMEGVIEHGVNGFLCEAGNAEELASIIKQIQTLSDDERKLISDAAIATSLKLTDVVVAKDYIETVVGFGEKIRAKSEEEVDYHSMQIIKSHPSEMGQV